ncbi:Carbonyl reductase [NADPH] 1 [Cytospora mali]|uniref:Carbonyl reductase [NADPH] 1 n=1 Tax=Cytospora mali TaxID=578113 RepID=A0A194UYA8_CYTMA|nr:Carbonyl reductase [NADPH] 1 [Valsa mali var. pyri (nom. inval.)]
MTADIKTIVLVTGANQGIGLEITRKLTTEHKDYHVIMAGRRKEAIEQAANKLQAEGLSVEPLVLDVTSDDSITAAAKAIGDKHGHLGVLINNAAISSAPDSADGSKPLSTRQQFLRVLDTNVAGVQAMTDTFIPLLEKSDKTKRIVFITSSLSSMSFKADPKLGFSSRKLEYWHYTTSKSALNMLALHYAVRYEGRDDWKWNLCCPGYCATNLNEFAGTHPPEHGAINACRLATLGPDGESGTFTDKDGVVPW